MAYLRTLRTKKNSRFIIVYKLSELMRMAYQSPRPDNCTNEQWIALWKKTYQQACELLHTLLEPKDYQTVMLDVENEAKRNQWPIWKRGAFEEFVKILEQ